MDQLETLQVLSSQMELEHAEEARGSSATRESWPSESAKPACFTPKEKRAAFVHPAQLPNGKQVKLLKTLLSSACERDCYYCPFRAGRDFRRATFKPQEFAELFMKLYQANLAEGIFLSSGIAAGGANTQNKILEGMAMGVPVVASVAAAGGVDAEAPGDFLVASTPDEYVAAVLRILEDRDERERLARAGRARMLSHHAWPSSMARLDAIVDRCLARAAGKRAAA